MKLRRVLIENVRSFLDPQELHLPGDTSIVIGPNGGGKTNLLDTVILALRLYVLKSWTPRPSPTPEWPDRHDWAHNDSFSSTLLERHSAAAPAQQQRIELDLEVTETDITNMELTKSEVQRLQTKARSRYTAFPGERAANWNLDNLRPGMIFPFQIVNETLSPPDSVTAETFRDYLETFEINSRVRAELEERPLSMPMLSLPANRSTNNAVASISLIDFSEHELKKTVDTASSRTTSPIASLAIGRLAARRRNLLERDDGKASINFRNDPTLAGLNTTLKALGYDWDLKCTNTLRNQYDVILTKQGTSFRIGSASSGERELLLYLFAIYGLNVRDALIVIDEPELHLHPRWQQTLLKTFEQLSRDTGNQFLLATHSPTFISPSSIQNRLPGVCRSPVQQNCSPRKKPTTRTQTSF